jgi:2-methylcitrate dehydratase PrpD
MVGARALVKEGNVALDDIERIDVITNADFGVGFHEKEPDRLCDQEFSMPYQVSAALFAGDKGPNWYSDRVARSPEIADMKQRVTLSFDQEAHDARHLWMSKVVIHTKSGRHYSKRVDGPTNTLSDNEVREKFITTASQVIDQGQADKLRNTIENLEKVEDISELVGLLHAPTPRGA